MERLMDFGIAVMGSFVGILLASFTADAYHRWKNGRSMR